MKIVKIQESALAGMVNKCVHVAQWGVARVFQLESYERNPAGTITYTLRTPKSRKTLHTTLDLCYTNRYLPYERPE